jgi:putative redox protein
MAVEINLTYTGDLHCTAVHAPSRKSLETDAPVDNGGKGESFSPTDLVATALGACLLTIMDLVARRNQWNLQNTRVQVFKEMVAAPTRRIGSLKARIIMPPTAPTAAHDRAKLEAAARACPVKQSLHPDVEVQLNFEYQQTK